MIDVSWRRQLLLACKYPQATGNFLIDKIFYRGKQKPFPRIINCFITEKCNFNCPMCHVKESRFNRMGELSFNDLKKIFDEAKNFFSAFQLTGGEPLLHADVAKMIDYLTKNGMVKGVVTNGLLLEEKAEALIKAGLDFLAISLDGPDDKTQFERCRVRNSFEKIQRGIKKVATIRGKNLFPNIRIATVVSHTNLNNFEKILEISEKAGSDQWSISHYFYYYDEIKNKQVLFARKYNMGLDVWGEYLGKNKEFFDCRERKLLEKKLGKILEFKKKNKSQVKITLPICLDVENYYKGIFPRKDSVCTSPYNQIFIRGNGDIEMCQGYILGNIKKNTILEAWQGDKAKHFREIFAIHKVMPACFRCCALEVKFK